MIKQASLVSTILFAAACGGPELGGHLQIENDADSADSFRMHDLTGQEHEVKYGRIQPTNNGIAWLTSVDGLDYQVLVQRDADKEIFFVLDKDGVQLAHLVADTVTGHAALQARIGKTAQVVWEVQDEQIASSAHVHGNAPARQTVGWAPQGWNEDFEALDQAGNVISLPLLFAGLSQAHDHFAGAEHGRQQVRQSVLLGVDCATVGAALGVATAVGAAAKFGYDAYCASQPTTVKTFSGCGQVTCSCGGTPSCSWDRLSATYKSDC